VCPCTTFFHMPVSGIDMWLTTYDLRLYLLAVDRNRTNHRSMSQLGRSSMQWIGYLPLTLF
jgi:hypothetical protein